MYQVINCHHLLKYNDGLIMQEKAFEKVRNNEYKGILFILEHHPVYTIGASGGLENILCSEEYLEKQGIDIFKIKRGGNITFHGPGQIVAYPVFNLASLKKDAHWYMGCLEDIVIEVLKQYGLLGYKKPQYRGAWINEKKICAVGVSLKKWITCHGLAFNVNVDKKYFSMINPCGITEFGVSSLEDYMQDVNISNVKEDLVQSFENVFNIKIEEAGMELLEESDEE